MERFSQQRVKHTDLRGNFFEVLYLRCMGCGDYIASDIAPWLVFLNIWRMWGFLWRHRKCDPTTGKRFRSLVKTPDSDWREKAAPPKHCLLCTNIREDGELYCRYCRQSVEVLPMLPPLEEEERDEAGIWAPVQQIPLAWNEKVALTLNEDESIEYQLPTLPATTYTLNGKPVKWNR